MVDDVVERGGEAVPLGGVEGDACAVSVSEAMDHVVRDPVTLVLALAHVLRERRALRVVGEQVAQEQRGPQHVAS